MKCIRVQVCVNKLCSHCIPAWELWWPRPIKYMPDNASHCGATYSVLPWHETCHILTMTDLDMWTCDTYREIGMNISCRSYERTFCVIFWPLVSGPLQTNAARYYFRVRTTACWVSGHHLLNSSYDFPHRSSVLGCQLFHMKVYCCKAVTLQLSLRIFFNPLLFASCTDTFSKWCKITRGMKRSAQ
jgi:hypothetical protein